MSPLLEISNYGEFFKDKLPVEIRDYVITLSLRITSNENTTAIALRKGFRTEIRGIAHEIVKILKNDEKRIVNKRIETSFDVWEDRIRSIFSHLYLLSREVGSSVAKMSCAYAWVCWFTGLFPVDKNHIMFIMDEDTFSFQSISESPEAFLSKHLKPMAVRQLCKLPENGTNVLNILNILSKEAIGLMPFLPSNEILLIEEYIKAKSDYVRRSALGALNETPPNTICVAEEVFRASNIFKDFDFAISSIIKKRLNTFSIDIPYHYTFKDSASKCDPFFTERLKEKLNQVKLFANSDNVGSNFFVKNVFLSKEGTCTMRIGGVAPNGGDYERLAESFRAIITNLKVKYTINDTTPLTMALVEYNGGLSLELVPLLRDEDTFFPVGPKDLIPYVDEAFKESLTNIEKELSSKEK